VKGGKGNESSGKYLGAGLQRGRRGERKLSLNSYFRRCISNNIKWRSNIIISEEEKRGKENSRKHRISSRPTYHRKKKDKSNQGRHSFYALRATVVRKGGLAPRKVLV